MRTHSLGCWRGPAAGLVLGSWLLTGCGAAVPSPRLDTLLPADIVASMRASGANVPGALIGTHVGLVVLQDTEAPGSVAPLSGAGLDALAQHTRARLQEVLPIETSIPVAEALDAQGMVPVATLVRRYRLDALAVAIYSAVEVDDPQPFALDGNRGGGGAMGRVPGTVTSIYALAEVAVIDAVSGARVAQSEGRTSVHLEQLARHMDSNAFPAIYRAASQQRIAAPVDPGEARDATRSLAFHDALEQAAYDLPRRWPVQQGRPPQGRAR